MEINIRLEGVDKVMKDLEMKRGNVLRAASTAINRAATHARAQVTKISRQEYTAKAKSVREAIDIKKSKPNTLMAEVVIGRKVVPLIDYQSKGGATERKQPEEKSVRTRRRRITPVQVMVKRSGGYKMLPKAFKATMKFGRKIFIRTGKGKIDITALSGPSLGGITQANMIRIMQSVRNVLSREFKGALQYALRGKYKAND